MRTRTASSARPSGSSKARRSSRRPCTAWPWPARRRWPRLGKTAADVDLVVPHQANLRIIEAVAKRAGVPMERVFVNVQRYGNMSAATVPVALCEALEEGRVKPGALLLMPSFGGGLTFTGHVVRWGERVTPLGTSDVELPPNNQTRAGARGSNCIANSVQRLTCASLRCRLAVQAPSNCADHRASAVACNSPTAAFLAAHPVPTGRWPSHRHPAWREHGEDSHGGSRGPARSTSERHSRRVGRLDAWLAVRSRRDGRRRR